DGPLHGVALRPFEEQLHLLPPAQAADGAGVARHQTLLRFFGRQPLWGMGVTSLMPDTSRPEFCRLRMAVSRPDPGPLTSTSTLRMPCSMAAFAAFSAASWAAHALLL